jgi:tetratricopeptide (TPR) repeat protein
MKRILYWLTISSLLLATLSGCGEDFLDRHHPGTLGYDNLYLTESDFQAALSGTYQSIMGTSTNTVYLGELAGDNAYVSRFQTSGAQVDLDRLGFNAETGIFSTYWSSNYTTIQRVNLLLDKLGTSSLGPGVKEKITAEAKFLRAYAYFNLVRVFGGVPLYPDYVELSAIYDVARATETETFALIIADLQQATLLDSYRTATENAQSGGRATTVAAQLLLGKAYLWQGNFQAAETVLEEVINSGRKLVDLQELFHPDKPFNDEIIFSINYDRSSGFGSPFASAAVPYNAPQGLVYPNVPGRTGGGLLMVEPFVAEQFDPADKRKTGLLRQVTFENLGTTDTHIYSLKYIDSTTTFNGLSGANTIILRYADAVLSYAEALNENGKTARAAEYVNQVRVRAGLDELAGSFSKEAMFELLAQERQKEFLLEGDRWFDLRYRGFAYLKSQMTTFMPHAYLDQNRSLQITEALMLFPIPESQLQIKPVLTQNSGY